MIVFLIQRNPFDWLQSTKWLQIVPEQFKSQEAPILLLIVSPSPSSAQFLINFLSAHLFFSFALLALTMNLVLLNSLEAP